MTTTYRDAAITSTRTKRGTGSIRERSPGVWEIRVVVGFDPVLGRSVQRSFTVHGDPDDARLRRRELVDAHGVSRVDFTTAGARLTVGELLERFLEAPHLWKPATVVSHRPVIHALLADPLSQRRLAVPDPAGDVRATICRWRCRASRYRRCRPGGWCRVRRCRRLWGRTSCGSTPPAGIKGPPRPMPRLHHTITEVRLLLRTAEATVDRIGADLSATPGSARCRRRLFSAERTLLLVRPAADSGARRGELAALRHSDLGGRVLSIERGLSRRAECSGRPAAPWRWWAFSNGIHWRSIGSPSPIGQSRRSVGHIDGCI